jgi:PBP1b-binding outer membrane lipoprotein LpoB
MRKKNIVKILILSLCFVTGCSDISIEKPPPPRSDSGTQISQADIAKITHQMVQDILSTPQVINHVKAPRVVLDSKYFINESSSPINKNMLTDRLRVELGRAAKGKLVFATRERLGMIFDENDAETGGLVTHASQGKRNTIAGWDFRLVGRITSQDSYSPDGSRSRFFLISMELINRSGITAWSKNFEVRKTGRDHPAFQQPVHNLRTPY